MFDDDDEGLCGIEKRITQNTLSLLLIWLLQMQWKEVNDESTQKSFQGFKVWKENQKTYLTISGFKKRTNVIIVNLLLDSILRF